MDYGKLLHPIKTPYIPELIYAVKNRKLGKDTQYDIQYILEMFGYNLLTIVHHYKIFDLFDPKHSHLLIVILNECHLEYDQDAKSMQIKSLLDYLSSIEDISPNAQHRIMRKLYRMDTIKKIDRIWHLLRDLYDISVGQKYINMAYSKYSERDFKLYFPQTLPPIKQDVLIVDY